MSKSVVTIKKCKKGLSLVLMLALLKSNSGKYLNNDVITQNSYQ